jgi:hypothetical protein
MQIKYVIILTIILIFLYLNLPDIEKMYNSIQPVDDNLPNIKIPKINLIKPGEKVEILDLPFCKKNFKVEYGSNTNYVQNDGKKIYQDISTLLSPWINKPKEEVIKFLSKFIYTWDNYCLSLLYIKMM